MTSDELLTWLGIAGGALALLALARPKLVALIVWLYGYARLAERVRKIEDHIWPPKDVD